VPVAQGLRALTGTATGLHLFFDRTVMGDVTKDVTLIFFIYSIVSSRILLKLQPEHILEDIKK
jgi:hypothetical protein